MSSACTRFEEIVEAGRCERRIHGESFVEPETLGTQARQKESAAEDQDRAEGHDGLLRGTSTRRRVRCDGRETRRDTDPGAALTVTAP